MIILIHRIHSQMAGRVTRPMYTLPDRVSLMVKQATLIGELELTPFNYFELS
jgi:hypothetical protein